MWSMAPSTPSLVTLWPFDPQQVTLRPPLETRLVTWSQTCKWCLYLKNLFPVTSTTQMKGHILAPPCRLSQEQAVGRNVHLDQPPDLPVNVNMISITVCMMVPSWWKCKKLPWLSWEIVFATINNKLVFSESSLCGEYWSEIFPSFRSL